MFCFSSCHESFVDQQVDHYKQIQKINRDLEGQNKYLQKVAFGGGGLDKKPCWADKTGKVEYIYLVTISEEKIIIDRA